MSIALLRRLAVWALLASPLWATAQPLAFNIPDKVVFCDQKLILSSEAKAKVQKHGQALVRNSKYYRSMTDRADAYFPLIERVFREEGLPDDFKYLCIQESGLTSDVVSSSKAVGYWQFKAETAMGVGLRVDNEVDERMHIAASSRGAAKYLTKNNQYLHNWTHTLLSYYAGLGGTTKLVSNEHNGSKEMELDSTTHPYILKFLAHKLAYEQAVNRSPNPPLRVEEYPQARGKTLRQVADETNVDLAQIEFYNKWCRTGVVPADKDYVVMVPLQNGARPSWMSMTTRPTPVALGENIKPWKERTFFGLIEKDPEPVDPRLNQDAPVFLAWNGIKAILARKQDNLNRLSLAAGISKEDLMDYNDLRLFDLIVPGQVYYVKAKRKKAKVPFHTVRLGETVWEVAQSYGITLKALLKKNRMNSPEKLAAGRILWLRHTRPEDHPVEYDPTIHASPAIPATPALPPVSPAIASIGAVPVSAVITAAPRRADADAPTMAELKEKYEAVQENTTTEEITIPTLTTETPEAKPEPVTTPLPAIIKAAKAAPAPALSAPALNGKTHFVEPGQTLYGIARQYGVKADALSIANPVLAEAGLKPGMTLSIPEAIAAKPTPALGSGVSSASHTVAAGETLYAIARRYATSVDQLKALNPGIEALKVGMELRVR